MPCYKWLTDQSWTMVDITILELHLDDSSLTANAPFSSGRKQVSASDEPPEEESSGSKGKAIGAVVGLVFLAVVAYVVKSKVLGGGDEPEGEEFEVADVKA